MTQKVVYLMPFDHTEPSRPDNPDGSHVYVVASRVGDVGSLPTNLVLIEADETIHTELQASGAYPWWQQIVEVPLA